MNEVVKHSNDMEQEHRKGLIRTALRSISGDYDVLKEKAMWLLDLLKNTKTDIVEKTLARGVRTYEDNFNKYPKNTFWLDTLHDIRREARKADNKPIVGNRDSVSNAERSEVQLMAREQAERFAVISEKDNSKPHLYTKKMERYRKYIDDDLVRIEDSESVAFQNWVPREQAVKAGMVFHDPVKWVKKREDELGRM